MQLACACDREHYRVVSSRGGCYRQIRRGMESVAQRGIAIGPVYVGPRRTRSRSIQQQTAPALNERFRYQLVRSPDEMRTPPPGRRARGKAPAPGSLMAVHSETLVWCQGSARGVRWVLAPTHDSSQGHCARCVSSCRYLPGTCGLTFEGSLDSYKHRFSLWDEVVLG